MTFNKKIRRTMGEHKSQYIGSIFLIGLACLMYIMFHNFGSNIVSNLDLFKSEFVQEDAHFITQSGLKNIDILESRYNVLIEERLSIDLAYDDTATLRILSKTDEVNRHYVLSGEDIENNDEILLDQGFAKAHQIEVGDEIALGDVRFRVTGFVASPDYIYVVKTETDMIKAPKTFGFGIVEESAFNEFTNANQFYSIFYKDPTGVDSEALKKEINDSNIILKWVDKEDNIRISFIENDLKGIEPLSNVMPVVIMFVTSMLVSVVMARLIRQERVFIGLFYAIGYRKKEILFHYLKYALIMSLIGGSLGTLLGGGLVKPYLIFAANIYNLPIFHIDYQYAYMLVGFFLPFVFLIPATWMTVSKSLSSTPLELLRNRSLKVKRNIFERFIKLESFTFSTQFKIREVFRNIPRIVLLLAGVIVSSSLILVGFIMNDSLNEIVGKSLDDVFEYRYRYTFKTFQFEDFDAGEPSTVGSFFSMDEDGKSENIMVYGIRSDSDVFNFRDSENHLIDTDQTIVTKAVADRFNLKVGDSLDVTNAITHKTFRIRVDAIAEFYISSSVYMPIDIVNTMCAYPEDSFLELYIQNDLDIDPSLILSRVSKADAIEGYKMIMKPLNLISMGIGGLAFVIGLIVLYVIISLIVQENKQTISMLKILGYYKREVNALVLNTFTLFIILGYVLTLPVIINSMDQFFSLMTSEMGMTIPISLKPFSIFLGFLSVMVVYEVSKAMNKRKVNRVAMIDSLKNRAE